VSNLHGGEHHTHVKKKIKFFFFFDLEIFIGQLPLRRQHWSLALLVASGDQTRGAAGPSALTDGT
jgi:hypothetical protein